MVGEQRRIVCSEVCLLCVIVVADEEYAVAFRSHPFAVGFVYRYAAHADAIEQIVSIVCAVVAWHFVLCEGISSFGYIAACQYHRSSGRGYP